ncbi:hypothetical protein MMC18_001784 [Xylographa bjoerkii]|nr:hypothetical protein [Xylographa bjoerkii]
MDNATGSQPSLYTSILSKYRPDLHPYEELYKHFHANGELSTQESETASLLESHLRKLSPDFDIRTSIGGHGLIAILKNGTDPGPTKTILLRADMDALPMLEKTDLQYASKKTMQDVDGEVKPVMHACGHDFHITAALGAAETLIASRTLWQGTIIFLFQPAEERALGAKAMVEDGLYDPERHACPLPDVVLGQHVLRLRAGTVATVPGAALSAADSFEITIYGRGGHGSMPHLTIDPVVVACHVVVRLQTVVSREVPPDEIAVITVGSLRSGSTEDVISNEAVLKINIRSVSVEWREKILESMERIVKLECEIAQCPKPPSIKATSRFPLTLNDADTTAKLTESFTAYFGDAYNPNMRNALASEDFSILGSAIDRPYCFWFWGGIAPEVWDEHERNGTLGHLPGNHSQMFAPILQPTLRTGVDAMTVAALTFLGGK